MIRLIIFVVLVLALDFYALQSFRSVVRNPWVKCMAGAVINFLIGQPR